MRVIQVQALLALHPDILDAIRALPRGTPEEVRAETSRVMADFDALNGGAVIAPAHIVQADTPPENVVAMAEALRG